jgi:ABC-type transport system involved in cytochrome c biogenesis permease subunit
VTNASRTNARPNGSLPVWSYYYIAVTLVVLGYGFYEAMTAPTEATMGNLYRVFFYHLPHAILSFIPRTGRRCFRACLG